MDIEKAFDSLDYSSLISILKKIGLGKSFINWIDILLKDQQLCIINGGKTTHVLTWKEALAKVIQSRHVFFSYLNCFLYSAYADDTTFFFKDAQSIENLFEIFKTIFLF